jgi:hypothetical protein
MSKYILNADTFVRELVTSDAPFDNKQKYYVQRIYENEEDYLRDYSNKYIIVSAGNRIRVTAEMSFEPNKKYYTETVHTYGYTDAKLPEPVVFTNSNPDKKPDGVLNGYKTDLTDDTGKLWQENYEPVLKDCIIDTYLGSYTHDTYEYRMAKMLSECEQYLCMDSIVYHYLFIERHSMVDNVAKNTFWSTEDGLVWNLTKNYDNDTADGIDNSGDLILSYGIEPGDLKTDGTGYFNANDSVWFNFIRGLYPACQKMYNELDALGAWDPN